MSGRPARVVDAFRESTSQNRTIIFLHVPKAAGSTVARMLRRKFEPRFLRFAWSRVESKVRELQDFDHAHPGVRVIAGHFGYGVHEALSGDVEYFTLLRNPAERMRSYYRYARTTPGHYLHDRLAAEDPGFEEFLLSRMTVEIDNFQTRLFSGEGGGVNEKPFGELGAADLEKAKRRLEHDFAIVGLSEDVDGAMLLWKQHFGWANAFYEKFNVTQESLHRADLTPAAVQAIRETQALDLELYACAQARFAAAVAAYDGDYEADLASFRRWNRLYGRYVRAEHEFVNYYRAALRRLGAA